MEKIKSERHDDWPRHIAGLEGTMYQPRHIDRLSPGSAPWRCVAMLLAVCLLALLGGAARGQQLPLRNFGQLDGLANLTVTALAQDRAGYLWAGTENGLYRFDGSRFHRYGRLQDSSVTSVTALHVDPAGRLWVGTDHGLLLLDGQRLTPVRRIDGKALEVKAGQHFASVDANHLLVQSNGRLQQVQADGKGGWHGVPVFTPAQTTAQPELTDLAGILREPDGTLWLGCQTKLCRYRDGALVMLGGADGLPERRWHALLRDLAGALWVGASDRLMTLAPREQRFSDRTPGHYGELENGLPVALAQNIDGHLISASDNGLFRAGAGGWEHYGGEHGVYFGNGVHALLFDHDGDLWLGFSGRGLVQWQGYRHWENWAKAQGVPDDDVWSLLRTRDGVLHAGTGHGLAQRRDGRFIADTAEHANAQPWGALAEDSQGDLWAGSFNGMLIRRDRRSGQSRVVARLQDKIIYRLLFDDAGQLWISTDRGIYLIADPRHASAPQRVEPAVALLGVNAGFPSACRDARGRLWFASPYGLLRLEGGRWSRPVPASGDHVFDHVACDGETLWLGESHGTRLWRADASQQQLQLHPFKHELLEGRLIQSVLLDRRHWLWLSTDTGLMVWNGSRWRLFNQQSGMIWNDTNQNALYEDRDGSIWVGTSNGVSHLLRPEALFAPYTIPLHLVSMRYGGAALTGASAPWNGAAVEVQVAAPLYRNHEALSFRYRLLGQEDAWSTSNNGELRYAALAPGQYRLQIVADDTALQASSATLELPLTIHPPWWQTRWAYAAGTLLTLGLVGLLHRYRVARVLRQQALLEQRVAERTAALEASREEHRLRALKDGLTQAWNRTALMERLALMTAPGAPPFLLVLLDLDYFKRVNDTYGHLAGDEVLREVVRRAQALLRASDTVGRYGGEEFMLLMPGLDMGGGGPRLEQLHRAIGAEPVSVDGVGPLPVTCSAGVVVGQPGLRLSAEQWIGLADEALYRAKALGRNRIEYAAEAAALALQKND
ncbi:diguanylate cyclase [Duganella sp. BJB475]|nr:diguanylate cyclase [Duganella sp. BJB475]RFP25294.1 diguanylate cyclase [Duganella sp. BJB476]